jgi:hypothetical protein
MLLHERIPAIPVAAGSKAEVCSRSIAGIEGSNPDEGTDVSVVFVVFCVRSGLCDGLMARLEES